MKHLVALSAICLITAGCVGGIRDTSTPRTSTEILLVSTAANRAAMEYDASALAGKNVYVDTGYFDSVDKNYVVSALRDHLAGSGVILADAAEGADLTMEIRNGTLGIWDGDFVLGIPQLPFAAQGLPAAMLPPLYLFRRLSAQGYAKFQLWIYEPATKAYVSRSKDLWGKTYYNQWWVLGIGPFDGSNDIYPEFLDDYTPEGEDEE